MKEYDTVKVVKLDEPERRFTGSDEVKRPPKIGDVGTIVYVLSPAEAFIVECVNKEGLTVWLADFTVNELERGEV